MCSLLPGLERENHLVLCRVIADTAHHIKRNRVRVMSAVVGNPPHVAGETIDAERGSKLDHFARTGFASLARTGRDKADSAPHGGNVGIALAVIGSENGCYGEIFLSQRLLPGGGGPGERNVTSQAKVSAANAEIFHQLNYLPRRLLAPEHQSYFHVS